MTNQQFVTSYFANPGMNGRHQNLFAEYGILYSYGYHFPLCLMHEGKFYVNADSYSRTTGKHRRLCINEGATPVDGVEIKRMMEDRGNYMYQY